MDVIDPLIKKEFERLGFNIIADEKLADLIISKARHERLKRVLIATGGALLIAGLIFGISHLFDSGKSVTGTANSITQTAGPDGAQPLPLNGYLDIDGSSKSSSRASFTFKLSRGSALQVFTDYPADSMGSIGAIYVYQINSDGTEFLSQKYELGSRTHIQEFMAQADALYRWDLVFNDPAFMGRVRYAFIRIQ